MAIYMATLPITHSSPARRCRVDVKENDTSYGLEQESRDLGVINPPQYFPGSDEQIGGPFSPGKYWSWLPPLPSVV